MPFQAMGECQRFLDMMDCRLTAVWHRHEPEPDEGFVATMELHREDEVTIDRHRGIGIRNPSGHRPPRRRALPLASSPGWG